MESSYSFCLGVALIYKVSLIENKRVVDRPDLEKNLSILKQEIERRVASELVMGSVNATVHVVKDNILENRSEAKRENYLSQTQMLHEKCRHNHFEIIDKLN